MVPEVRRRQNDRAVRARRANESVDSLLVQEDGSCEGAAHDPERKSKTLRPSDDEDPSSDSCEHTNERERVPPRRNRRRAIRLWHPVRGDVKRRGEVVIVEYERPGNPRE